MSKTQVSNTEKEDLAAPANFAFKVKKNITLPLIKLELDIPVYIKITDKMFVGKEVKGTGDKAKMEPAILTHCIDLKTGEPSQIILNAVIVENLKEHYPDDAYVDKSFEFIKHPKREGKRYFDFSLTEIEV